LAASVLIAAALLQQQNIFSQFGTINSSSSSSIKAAVYDQST